MIALITGINGFAGQHLEKLLTQKKIKVFGIEKDYKGNKGYLRCDITDIDEMKKIIIEINPDIIFHLAAISSVKVCEENPALARKINVSGFENILKIIQGETLKTKVLFTSSSHVYKTKGKGLISEDDELNPVSVYGKTKIEAEKLIKKYNVKAIVVRSFNHIGPGQAKGFITSDFAGQIAKIENTKEKKGTITVGNIETVRDYTDVRDIVNAYYILMMKKENGIYNVCMGAGFSGKELLEKMLKLSPAKIKIIKTENMPKNDIESLIGNNSKIKKATGWEPKIPIDESLKDILNYWRKKEKGII